MSNSLSEEQLKIEIERAATAMLSDDEITVSLGITDTVLKRHYSIVEQARIKLKQRLNSKRISDVASGSGKVQDLVNNIPKSKPEKGSWVKGKTNNPSGRPKGSTNKLSAQHILETIAKYDVPFEIGLAEDYARARRGNDGHLIHKYQQLILNKVVADKTEITVTHEAQIDMIMDLLLGTSQPTVMIPNQPSPHIVTDVTPKPSTQGVTNGKENNRGSKASGHRV
jgi:hypothetical protein